MMRRAAAALAGLGLLVGLTGCAELGIGDVNEEPVFEYGPCSTQQECYDATYPMATSIGGDLAIDCVAANTSASGDMITKLQEGETEITVDATSGDCKVVITMTGGTTITGEVYDLR